MKYSIAKEYTKNPGARFIEQGSFSGQDFRQRVLEPFFKDRKGGERLEIDFDGLNGYPSSFFEEAFGGIARIYSPDVVLSALILHCDEDPLFLDDLRSYIRQERATGKAYEN